MIRLTLTQSGGGWYDRVPVKPQAPPEQYAGSPLILVDFGYVLDLRGELGSPIPYDDIVGLTIAEIRALIGGDQGPPELLMLLNGLRGISFFGSDAAEWVVSETGDISNNPRLGNDVFFDGQANGPPSDGVDRFYGGRGNDSYVIDSVSTIVSEYRVESDGSVTEEDAGGLDYVAVRGDYQLPEFVETLILRTGQFGGGNAENNSIFGNVEANILNGGTGDDQLIGYGDRDILSGGEGDDILAGDWNNDILSGGEGTDIFYFDRARRGRDSILDFDENDVVLLRSPVRDKNGDGIIGFGGNNVLDIGRKASVAIAGVEALEYDGMTQVEGVALYVYSLPGSTVGLESVAAMDLSNLIVNLT